MRAERTGELGVENAPDGSHRAAVHDTFGIERVGHELFKRGISLYEQHGIEENDTAREYENYL